MPPAKARPLAVQQAEDSRSDVSTSRDRPYSTATSKKGKNVAGNALTGASTLKELALVSTASGEVVSPTQNAGMQWSTIPIEMLDSYRVAYNIQSPPAFFSPLSQALLTNPGIGRHSPTMARRKDKRPVSRDALATAVRKHFNGAAVNEIEVVVELAYKTKHRDKAFRMRSAPTGIKK